MASAPHRTLPRRPTVAGAVAFYWEGRSDGDHDLAPGVPRLEVPDGLGGVAQWEGTVEEGGDGAVVGESGEALEAGVVLLVHDHGQALGDEGVQQRGVHLTAHAGAPGGAVLAADDNQRPGRGKGVSQSLDGRDAADVQDDVERARAVGEVLLRVVDDVRGAQVVDKAELVRAGDTGDGRAGCGGQLDGVRADAAGRADDEDGLSGPY